MQTEVADWCQGTLASHQKCHMADGQMRGVWDYLVLPERREGHKRNKRCERISSSKENTFIDNSFEKKSFCVCLNKNYSLTRSSSSFAKQFLKDKYNLLSWMKSLEENVLKLRSWLQNSLFSDAFEHPVVFQEQHPIKRMFLLQCHNQCQPYGIDYTDNKVFTCELSGGTVSNTVDF